MATLDPEYARQHWLVRKLRGKASTHRCAHCENTARDWATIHGLDGSDPQKHYMPLCRSCHTNYDGHPMLGRHHSEESREKMRQAHLGKMLPEEQLEKMRLSQQARRAVENELGIKPRTGHRERDDKGRFL